VVQGGQMVLRIARSGGTDAVFECRHRCFAQPRATSRRSGPDRGSAVRATGRVREVSPQANPITGTFTVRVGLDDPPNGMLLGSWFPGASKLASDRLVVIPRRR